MLETCALRKNCKGQRTDASPGTCSPAARMLKARSEACDIPSARWSLATLPLFSSSRLWNLPKACFAHDAFGFGFDGASVSPEVEVPFRRRRDWFSLRGWLATLFAVSLYETLLGRGASPVSPLCIVW